MLILCFFTVEKECQEQVDKTVGAAVLAPAAQLLQEGLEMIVLQQQPQQHHVGLENGQQN
jgi:hypothetical protein